MMNKFPANCPSWLAKKIYERGGIISFYDYMDITLNDPVNGYYGSGKANIGIGGDFVTSTTMTKEFAELLAEQIRDWLKQILLYYESTEKLVILEFGAGDGSLLKDIISYFLIKDKNILEKISFLVVERNLGMERKQKKKLQNFLDLGVDIKWCNLSEVEKNSVNGIVIAHELLDAFPVERIQYSEGNLFQQGVSLDSSGKKLIMRKLKMNNKLNNYLEKINNLLDVTVPPENVNEGWTTELHVDNSTWLNNVYQKLNNGILLVIDYAIEARKYYSNKRQDGMLIAYKNQEAFSNALQNPGNCDLTSHICSDVLISEAQIIGYDFLGLVKQGEALLSLGLSEKLYEIQLGDNIDLSSALKKRESLLRLVDPLCLGDFKWFVFQRFNKNQSKIRTKAIN